MMLQSSPPDADSPPGDAALRPAPRDYSITELAGEFGLTARTLRHYEEIGILAPRRAGARRIYSHRDRARLSLAVRGRRVGFSLTEIREMLDLYDLRDGRARQLEVALSRFRERLGELRAQRDLIDETIGDLEGTCATIEGMLRVRERESGGARQ